MFLHLSVILSGGGGVSASVHAGIHTPRANTPLPSACWDTQCPVHAGIDMATAVDGTHPTGMHSFYRPQRSWGKVIFSEVCVKNSIHRGACMHGVRGRYYKIRSMSGRYTFYWNAFFFYTVYGQVVYKITCPHSFLPAATKLWPR